MTKPESEFTLKDGVLGHSTHLEKLPMTTWMTPKNLNRRDFFKLGAAACAGAVLSSGSAEAYPGSRRRLREGDPLCGIDIGSDQVRTVLARVPESSSEAEGTPQLEVLAVGQVESHYSVQYGDVMWLGRVTIPGWRLPARGDWRPSKRPARLLTPSPGGRVDSGR